MTAKAFIRTRFLVEPAQFGLCVMALRQSNKIIGIGGIIPCSYFNNKEYEFGFVIEKSNWKKGYATEIGKAQIDYGFNHLGLSRLFASVHRDNKASIRVLDKLDLRIMSDIDSGRKNWLTYIINKNE